MKQMQKEKSAKEMQEIIDKGEASVNATKELANIEGINDADYKPTPAEMQRQIDTGNDIANSNFSPAVKFVNNQGKETMAGMLARHQREIQELNSLMINDPTRLAMQSHLR